MCRDHWGSLRPATKKAIWRMYREGQESDKKPSIRYLAVQRFAIGEAVFKPNDEAAAALAAKYLQQAIVFREKAISLGAGDPLAGLVPKEC
jgi:hypothetical protein